MPPPVPPFDGGLRVSHGGRSATRGESKDELLARASAERATRLDARRRTHAALTVQRCWRGRRCASAALRELLREWDARFGDLLAPPPWDVARVALLPPVFLAGRALAGEQRCLRVCALALASVESSSGTNAPKTRRKTSSGLTPGAGIRSCGTNAARRRAAQRPAANRARPRRPTRRGQIRAATVAAGTPPMRCHARPLARYA